MKARGQATPYFFQDEEGMQVGTIIRYVAPWMLGVVTLLAGLAGHLGWGTAASVLPWITAAMALGTAGLAWLGWTVGRARHLGPAGRGQVVVTIAATGLWLMVAVVAGPFTRGVIDTWFLAWIGLSAAWNIRAGLHKPARQEDDEVSMTPRKAGRALLASIGMKGEDLKVTESDENRIGGKLVLTSGNHTTDDAQKHQHQIAAALGIPKSGVRFVENPRNAAEADFSFTMRDMLTDSTPWPGPSAIGGTVFDPIDMGVYETAAHVLKVLADKAGAKHELTQGASGSGKSSGTRVEVCEVMTRRQVAILMIDTQKGTQSFGPAAPGLAWFVPDESLAAKVLRRIKSHVIKARTSYLGAKGLDAWRPGCGLTFLILYIEEASNLFAEIGDDEVEAIAKAARSAGIALRVSLQRPDHSQMSTTLRAQLGTITCYGMANDDPVCLLPDAVQGAGADPRLWGDRQPGCHYMSGTGITIGQAATPARTYEITPERMAAHAERYGPGMDEIDPVTIAAFGELWAKRVPPVELVRRLNVEALRSAGLPAEVEGQVMASKVRNTGGADSDEIDTEETEEMEEEVNSLTAEEMGIVTEDEHPDDGTSIDDPIEGLDHEFRFVDPEPEASVDEARAAVAERIAGFEYEGRDVITVPDFADLVTSVSRSRSWFRKELHRLVKAKRLVDQGGGDFLIMPTDGEDTDGQDEEAAA